MKLKPGDTVRIVGERGTAKVRAILTSMHGALMKTQIGGFRRWNLDELRLVKRESKQRRTSMKIVLSILSTLCFVSPTFSQSKSTAKESTKKQAEPKYVITQHTVVPSKSEFGVALPPEDLYVIEYGPTVLKVKYSESQTSSAKTGEPPASGLHLHNAFQNPDVSQVPNVGVSIRACTFNKDRDHYGDLVIAIQSSDEPCMARLGDTLHFLPRPNADFTYVNFVVLSEKLKSK